MKILILCTGNSCRSQMAHGYFAHSLGENVEVYSAGTDPSSVNPHTITVMAEDGLDISHHTSNNMNEYVDIPFDVVLTVCDNAKESCPVYPGEGKTLHHNFPDPHGHELDEYRRVRAMIKEYCKEFEMN
ncbi:MAG: arsenate reductase [Maribacter sp.]|jgi:arsenate reductase